MTPEAPSDPHVSTTGDVAITDTGTGPTLIAVHGLPGSVRDYRWLGPVVEPHLRFVRIDLPASGGTPLHVLPSPYARDRAELVPRVMDALGVERACVVGHSMGGLVAMAAASRWPDRCNKLALLASVGRYPHRGFKRIPTPHAWSRALHAPLVGNALFPIYLRGLRAAGFRGDYTRRELAHMNACLSKVSFSWARRVTDRLKVPTMVAWANDDPLIEPSISEDLAAQVPNGPRLSWDTGGHNIQKSRAVEIGNELVAWLTQA